MSMDLDASKDHTINDDITKITKKSKKKNSQKMKNMGKRIFFAFARLKKSLDCIVDIVEASFTKIISIKGIIVGRTIPKVIVILFKLSRGAKRKCFTYVYFLFVYQVFLYRDVFRTNRQRFTSTVVIESVVYVFFLFY